MVFFVFYVYIRCDNCQTSFPLVHHSFPVFRHLTVSSYVSPSSSLDRFAFGFHIVALKRLVVDFLTYTCNRVVAYYCPEDSDRICFHTNIRQRIFFVPTYFLNWCLSIFVVRAPNNACLRRRPSIVVAGILLLFILFIRRMRDT